MNHPEPWSEPQVDPDIVRQDAAQQLAGAGDDAVQVQQCRLQHCATRETQEVAGQLTAALGRHHRKLEKTVALRRIFRRLQQFEIAHDDGQQIVEIVRNSAGQLSHRLHLLRLSQTFFGSLRETMTSFSDSSQQLSSSAEQLTAVSQQMASNAEETSTQVGVVSAASEEDCRDQLESLERAGGFLRTKLARRLRLRSVPKLRFEFDALPEHASRIEALLAREDHDERSADGVDAIGTSRGLSENGPGDGLN